MGAKSRWIHRLEVPEKREVFVLAESWNKKKAGKCLNFWYTVRKQETFYSFIPNEKYHKDASWTEDLCRELVAELRKPKPGVEVTRFAVNGMYFFKADPSTTDEIPKIPVVATQKRYKPRKPVSEERRQIEEAKAAEPAPYILYGKHDGIDKEYTWKLNPDKPKRQGIQPGDRVLVWTSHGWEAVTCTKIEKVDRRKKKQPKPTARVKRKI